MHRQNKNTNSSASWCRNRSENYEFFQAVSHFTHESCSNKQLTTDSARKIYNLYVSEAAPLRVALGDEIYEDIKKVCVLIVVDCLGGVVDLVETVESVYLQ